MWLPLNLVSRWQLILQYYFPCQYICVVYWQAFAFGFWHNDNEFGAELCTLWQRRVGFSSAFFVPSGMSWCNFTGWVSHFDENENLMQTSVPITFKRIKPGETFLVFIVKGCALPYWSLVVGKWMGIWKAHDSLSECTKKTTWVSI